MIISTDTEKVSDKIQYAFMTKALENVGINEIHLNIIKPIYEKLTASINLNRENLEAIQLKSGNRQGYSLPLFLFNILFNMPPKALS